MRSALGPADCIRCGACCVNPRENELEGFRTWVEVEPWAPLLRRKDLVRKLVVEPGEGRPHLRPHACRRVEPGADDCLRYRAEHGLEEAAHPEGARCRPASPRRLRSC